MTLSRIVYKLLTQGNDALAEQVAATMTVADVIRDSKIDALADYGHLRKYISNLLTTVLEVKENLFARGLKTTNAFIVNDDSIKTDVDLIFEHIEDVREDLGELQSLANTSGRNNLFVDSMKQQTKLTKIITEDMNANIVTVDLRHYNSSLAHTDILAGVAVELKTRGCEDLAAEVLDELHGCQWAQANIENEGCKGNATLASMLDDIHIDHNIDLPFPVMPYTGKRLAAQTIRQGLVPMLLQGHWDEQSDQLFNKWAEREQLNSVDAESLLADWRYQVRELWTK